MKLLIDTNNKTITVTAPQSISLGELKAFLKKNNLKDYSVVIESKMEYLPSYTPLPYYVYTYPDNYILTTIGSGTVTLDNLDTASTTLTVSSGTYKTDCTYNMNTHCTLT